MPGPSAAVPDATVERLPLYHQVLADLAREGETTVSSVRLAELAGVNAAKVRKDLSFLGSYGTRGVGYDVEFLMLQVQRTLGLTGDARVVIVGFGNLGQALANYGGFGERGFPVTAIVDADPDKIGTQVPRSDANGESATERVVVEHVERLAEVVRDHKITVGVIATPQHAAQAAADALVAAGIQSILSFAPVVLDVPESVPWRKVDLATELQILSFYQARSGSLQHPA